MSVRRGASQQHCLPRGLSRPEPTGPTAPTAGATSADCTELEPALPLAVACPAPGLCRALPGAWPVFSASPASRTVPALGTLWPNKTPIFRRTRMPRGLPCRWATLPSARDGEVHRGAGAGTAGARQPAPSLSRPPAPCPWATASVLSTDSLCLSHLCSVLRKMFRNFLSLSLGHGRTKLKGQYHPGALLS